MNESPACAGLFDETAYNDKLGLFGYNKIMKTPQFYVLVIATLTLGMVACTPAEEDIHPKRRSSRSENLKRYVPKAQELRAQVQSRGKSIVNGPLLHSEQLESYISKMPETDISTFLKEHQRQLTESVRAVAAKQAATNTAKRLDEIRDEVISAAESADSPQNLAVQLKQFADQYRQALNTLAENVQQETWTVPTAEQSRAAHEELQISGEDFLTQLEDSFGNLCAQKARPVLAKAGDDYWLALSSIKQPEELQQALEKTGREADESLRETIKKYGDPKVSLTEQDIATLRAKLIEGHHAVEQQLEKLYGKQAVLKSRELFEPYLSGVDTVLKTEGRLSEKTAKLDELGNDYRQQVTALQVALNDELEKKISALGVAE